MVFWLAEMTFVLLLAGLAIRAPAPTAAAGILFVFFWSLSYLSRVRRPVQEGHLRRDRILMLICLFLLAVPLRVPSSGGVIGWWPAVAAGLLALAGLFYAVEDRRQGRYWSRVRVEMTLAAVVLVAASAAVAIGLRALLAFRSTMPIPAGKVDFLVAMSVWAGAWFGLDAHLRKVRESERSGVVHWLWNHRHPLGIGLAGMVVFLSG